MDKCSSKFNYTYAFIIISLLDSEERKEVIDFILDGFLINSYELLNNMFLSFFNKKYKVSNNLEYLHKLL